ncbi:MAG: translesion DNA synthesis-associated protein ImuA [Gammaproteobacteria bacterium]
MTPIESFESLPSGFLALDPELPGIGWPAAILTELISPSPGMTELRLLVPLMRRLTRSSRLVILVGAPELGQVPALAEFGIDPDFLLIVPARNAADRLWAVEQAVRSASFGVLLAWLPQDRCRPEHLRRLQALARRARGPVFAFRELPAQFQPSPAALRLLLLPRHSDRLSVQILKRRGPILHRPVVLDLPRPVVAIRRSICDQPLPGAIRSTASVITQSRPSVRSSVARSGSLMV